MFGALLFVIYLAFISLGLPDSLLGSAWPIIRRQISVPLSYSGIVFMIISVGTVISSLNSDRLIRRFGTGKVTAASTLTTVLALFGFSISNSFISLCLCAVPYGLGAGSIDAALNNYVALHYESRHMSWLHCMWGIGAATGPLLMSFALNRHNDWHLGYRYVGIIQALLTVILFISLPLWKKDKEEENEESKAQQKKSFREVIRISGVIEMMLAFFCYCALEQTTGLWASSWLVGVKNIDATIAARFAALFYTGITIGRAISGFITFKLNDSQMVRLGQGIIAAGLFMLVQNFSGTLSLFGLILIGLGCAPIYPSMIHSVPGRFGVENSQAIVGIQMASAYIGTSLMPPLFGWLTRYSDLKILPLYLIIILVIMIIAHEKLTGGKSNDS